VPHEAGLSQDYTDALESIASGLKTNPWFKGDGFGLKTSSQPATRFPYEIEMVVARGIWLAATRHDRLDRDLCRVGIGTRRLSENCHFERQREIFQFVTS
jgi:hypothetical protein